MALKCVAIDNDARSLQLLKAYIEKTAGLQLLQAFADMGLAVEFLRVQPADLLFVDARISQSLRIDAVRTVEPPMIIFITDNPNFVPEGFEPEAIDHLVKPVSYESFAKAVAKATEYYKFSYASPDNEAYLYVYSDYKLIKIDLNDIEFIESLEEHVRIHRTNATPILSLMPFRRVLQKLPPGKFERVHRSYVVSVNKIKGVNNKRIILAAAQVPVSDSYLEVVKKLKIG